jgi:nucleotide-binding universal stress UspA family protein
MRVLVAYDGSESSQAALDDLRLAGLGKSVEAIILSVAEVWLPPPESSLGIDKPFPAYTPPEVRKAHEITAQEIEKMSAVANEANTGLTALCPSWKVSSEARSGSPWDEVTKKANELQANLIVVGSHGRSALGRFLFGSVSQKILNEARCSVRVGRKRPDTSSSVRQLLVGVDGSPGSDAAVQEVARREWPPGMRIHVLTAEDPNVSLAFGGLNEEMIKGESGKGERPSMQTIVESSAAYLRQAGYDTVAEVKQGEAKKVLLEEAKRLGAGCIFVGASGWTNRLDHFLLGSVSTAVANRAECSVEVVRS